MQDIRQRLMKGAAWLGAARGLSNLIGFVNTIVLARLLTPADFGIVALALAMLALITASTELSLATALVQHKDPTEDHYHTAFTLSIVRASIIAAGFAAIAYPVAMSYGDDRLIGLMLALSGMTVIGGLTNPKMVTLTRRLVFWQEFLLTLAQKIVGFAVAVAIAFIYQSYWAIILGTIASTVTAVALSYVIVPHRPRFGWKHAREIWSFSGWLTLTSALNTINFKLDPLLIGWFLGRPTLGIYTVGDNLASLPIREAMTPIQRTLFPGFATVSHDPPRLRSACQTAQRLIGFVALPVGIGFGLVADAFVRVALGQQWLPAVFIIQMLSINFALATMVSALHPAALALGQTKFVFQRELAGFGLRVPAIVIGMISGGLAGIVIGRFLTGVVGLFFNMYLMRRLLGLTIRSQLVAHWRSLAGIAMMGIVVTIVDHSIPLSDSHLFLTVKLAVLVATGAVTYLAVCGGLWLALRRPDGPESDILRLASGFLSRRRASPAG